MFLVCLGWIHAATMAKEGSLERMLSLIEDCHALVIHCHGMEGDCGTETAGKDAVTEA